MRRVAALVAGVALLCLLVWLSAPRGGLDGPSAPALDAGAASGDGASTAPPGSASAGNSEAAATAGTGNEALVLRAEGNDSLPGLGRLRVRLTAPDGGPVSGFSVTLGHPAHAGPLWARAQERIPRTDGFSWENAVTDDRGVAELPLSFAGVVDEVREPVYVRAPDGRTADVKPVFLRAGALVDVTAVVARRPACRGRVVDDQGNPVAGALVWERLSNGTPPGWIQSGHEVVIDPPRWAVRTDAGGWYTLPFCNYPGGKALVLADGYRPGWPRLKPGGEAEECVLKPGAAVQGVVRRNGKPLAGAWVHCADGWTAYVFTTDAEGRFRFPGLVDGWIGAWDPADFWSGGARFDREKPVRSVEIEITRDPAAEAGDPARQPRRPLVRVRDEVAGSPVSNAEFLCTRIDGEGTAWVRPMEDTPGTFRMHVSAGRWELRVRARGYAEAVTEFDCADPAHLDPVEVRLKRGGARLRGRVLHPRGRPLEGARVELLGHHRDIPDGTRRRALPYFSPAVADRDGGFAFARLSGRPVWLRISSTDDTIVEELHGPFAPGGEPRDITVRAATAIRGIVTRGGRAASGVSVVCKRASRVPGRRNEFHATTDDRGRFSFRRLDPGRWQVGLQQRTYPRRIEARPRELRLLPGEAQEIRLEYPDFGTVSGRVHTTASLQGARVTLESPVEGKNSYGTTLEKDGRFHEDRVEPGEYRAVARFVGDYPFPAYSKPFQVLPGQQALVDIHFETGLLRVQLRWPEGTVVRPGRKVEIRARSYRAYNPGHATVGEDGLVELADVPAGRYVLDVKWAANSRHGRSPEFEFMLPPAKPIELTVQPK